MNSHAKYKHISVELKCLLSPPSSSTEVAIIIQLPSTSDWALNLDRILKAIPNTFQSFANIDASQWLLILNGTIIDKHDPITFGHTLSTEIPPIAVLEVVDFATLWNQSLPTHHPFNLPCPPPEPVDLPTQSFDINETTNEIINDMSTQEIHSLKHAISTIPTHDDFKLNWNHLVQCIRHEMWPVLASVIKGMLDNSNNQNNEEKDNELIDIHDLSEECMNKVIDMLKKKRRLPAEECHYLRHLMIRAKGFDPRHLSPLKDENGMDMDAIDYHKKGLTKSLLRDVFAIHKAFVFANFNFKEYTISQFIEDIAGSFGQEFIDTFADDLSFTPRFNFHPTFIVDDDIFRVFEYHFAVSLYVNTLKHTLCIAGNTFEVQSIVVLQSVSCVYDEDMALDDNIGSMDSYLIDAAIDFYKIRFGSHATKNPIDVAKQIEKHYNAVDIASNVTSALMVVVDRRASHQTNYDSMYIFACPDNQRNNLSQLQTNYFVAFDFKIIRNVNINENRTIVYFRFGMNGITRFFPELLVSVMPRLFRKPHQLSIAEYLYMLYDNTFRNGWCVTLEDDLFDKYYKMITGVTHVSVNYNRFILYDEFFSTQPMLCFTDLLHHELETHSHFNATDMYEMDLFFDEHDYCTDAIIDDIHDGHGSNLELSMVSNRKHIQFNIIQTIVNKYNEPSQKDKAKICTSDHVLNVDKCAFIQTIIDGLKQYSHQKTDDTHHPNISDLLGAYDHMVSVHGFCAPTQDPERTESTPFEEMDHSQSITQTQMYIVSEIGGYCTDKTCAILQKHIMRRRERQKEEMKDDHKSNSSDGLDEILHATLNALHCYILHEKKK
eukprot:976124_1